jgi:hypothetical protein
VEFHVHTYASLLIIGVTLFQNLTRKNDQLVVHAYRLLNKAKQNYSTIEREALAMVFALHKFRHYLLGDEFLFFVDHMALVYLINKPRVLRRITRWLLLLLEYDFTIVYELGRTHVVIDALSRLLDITKPTSVLD